MNNIQNKLIVFLLISFAFPYFAFSQNSLNTELNFEVNKIYPPISISKEKLKEAQTLIDLNDRYKSSWVRTYLSVEVLTINNGQINVIKSEDDNLSSEQKTFMQTADLGTEISVIVQYMPENNLKHNEPKQLDFKFSVNPENDAKYTGGQEALKQYLKENAINKIPVGSFEGYDLSAIKFTVDKDGQILSPEVFGGAYRNGKNEHIDKLLLDAISNMPPWKPAAYANGFKVNQDFVLTVGNMENCVVNLLNIHRD